MPAPRSRLRSLVRSFAWGTAILSFPVWGAAFVVPPFLPLELGQKALAAGVLLGLGELMFWGPAVILGAELVNRFRAPKVRTGHSFAGRRVAVMGATGGLGEAVARAVHREGGEPLLLGRDAQRLQALATELGAQFLCCDLSAEAQRGAAAAAGPVDHLVCATGLDLRKGLPAHSDDEVEAQLDVALLGPITVVRAWLPQLREGGSLVLLGGFGDGRAALPYFSVDVAARAGLAGFCASVNRELRLEGADARLSYLCPAPADTASERPFAATWAAMGSPLVAPEAVADLVLQTLISRREQVVMGGGNKALVLLERLAPPLADLLVQRRLGPPLRAAFGIAEEDRGGTQMDR